MVLFVFCCGGGRFLSSLYVCVGDSELGCNDQERGACGGVFLERRVRRRKKTMQEIEMVAVGW